MADKSNPANSSTQKILSELAELKKMMEALATDHKTTNTEVLGKLTAVQEQLAKAPKPRAASGSKGTGSSGAPSKPKGYNNSLYWFKDEWKARRDECVKKFANDKIMKALNNHMDTDEAAKTKTGDARLAAEAMFFWNNYVKPKECSELKKKIVEAFDKYKAETAAANKTPAKEDDEPAAADGDDDDNGNE